MYPVLRADAHRVCNVDRRCAATTARIDDKAARTACRLDERELKESGAHPGHFEETWVHGVRVTGDDGTIGAFRIRLGTAIVHKCPRAYALGSRLWLESSGDDGTLGTNHGETY